MTLLDEIVANLGGLSPEDRKEIEKKALDATKHMLWVPNPGPQTEAYYCEADELYFGGQAGGGKSDLGIGLALTAHKKSLLLRRLNDDARELAERTVEIVGHSRGLNRTLLRWPMDDRYVEFGGCQLEDDKQRYKGRPHDMVFFDEGSDFTKSQFEFIKIWNRSSDPNQRCRVIVASNPPMTSEGLWLIERWAAWLDPKHPNPAESGEIRWYLKVADDEEKEVDGLGPHKVGDEMIRATSRTFIRSRLEDNPDLDRSNYSDRLHLLPEELRKTYRGGSFEVGLQDHPRQVIPTQWVVEAQKRWIPKPPTGVPMCAMGVDSSGGGKDPMVVARRYDYWFDEMIEIPGKDLPIDKMGRYSAGIIVSNRKDNAVVIIDMGGGYGGSTYEKLMENNISCMAYKGSEKTMQRTADRMFGFWNMRSAAIWKFREALNPDQDGGSPIALPPDRALLADLTAPTFDDLTPRGIKVETKEDVVKRLGRSTNKGDAVIMSWMAGHNAMMGHRIPTTNRKPQVITKRTLRGHKLRRR